MSRHFSSLVCHAFDHALPYRSVLFRAYPLPCFHYILNFAFTVRETFIRVTFLLYYALLSPAIFKCLATQGSSTEAQPHFSLWNWKGRCRVLKMSAVYGCFLALLLQCFSFSINERCDASGHSQCCFRVPMTSLIGWLILMCGYGSPWAEIMESACLRDPNSMGHCL